MTYAQLQEELRAEQEALADAQRILVEIEQLQQELTTETGAMLGEVEPFADALRREREFLRTVHAETHARRGAVRDAWSHFSDMAIDMSAGSTNLEKVESFSAALGLGGWIADPANRHTTSTQAVTRIQRAQGTRKNVSDTSEADLSQQLLEILLNAEPLFSRLLPPAFTLGVDVLDAISSESMAIAIAEHLNAGRLVRVMSSRG